MTAGLKILTSDNTYVQIDGTNGGMPNYQLTAKQTVASVAGSFFFVRTAQQRQSVASQMAVFTVNAISPLFAFTTDGGWIAPVSVTASGNTWTVQVACTQACNVTMYTFDTANIISSGNNFGCLVRDDAGNLVADLTVPFCRPLAIQMGNMQWPYGTTGWYSGGGQNPPRGIFRTDNYGVSNVAVGCISIGWQYGANVNGLLMTAFNAGGSQVTGNFTSWGDVSNTNNYTGYIENLNYQYLAIDVTGY